MLDPITKTKITAIDLYRDMEILKLKIESAQDERTEEIYLERLAVVKARLCVETDLRLIHHTQEHRAYLLTLPEAKRAKWCALGCAGEERK